MDTEFINLYIAKQKALIDDLQSRLLLSETKLQLVEGKLGEANKIVESHRIDQMQKKQVRKE
jgi:hypothetical protein